MSKEFKIYHVETQEDYDDLMVKLENEGYKWFSGKKPTDKNSWVGEETVIYLDYCGNYKISYGLISNAIDNNHNTNIIKHKAEGVEQMGKVVVPKFVADWFELMEGHSLGVKFEELYLLGSEYSEWFSWMSGLETEDKFGYEVAEEIVAKMHLYGYEVEEEKKCYWRKKKEHILEFETTVTSTYLNCSYITGNLMFSNWIQSKTYQTKFTETEVRELVGEEDFNKLEKVEIEDV